MKPFSFAERDEKKAREKARKIREQRDEQDKIVLMASGTFKATELDKSILETSFDPETEEMERKKRIRERSEKLMRLVMKFLYIIYSVLTQNLPNTYAVVDYVFI